MTSFEGLCADDCRCTPRTTAEVAAGPIVRSGDHERKQALPLTLNSYLMIKKIVLKNEFAKNVLTVMTGTVLAQAVSLAIIPILTRIFTPEDFGFFALFGAFVSVLGVVVTGRYEFAIMLPEDHEDAKALLQASALIALFASIIMSAPLIIWNKEIGVFLGNEAISPWLYLIPASVFFTGIFQSLTYWNNRQKRFKNIAVSVASQRVVQGVSQTGLGFLQIPGGLIIGQLIAIISSVTYFLSKDRANNAITKIIDSKKITKQLGKYKRFPKYGIMGSLCDAGATQMPVFMLAKFYSTSVTGVFSLTFRVLNIPTIIIASAIGQVLFQKVVEISHTSPERLGKYISKMFFLLFLIYLPAVPILFIWGEPLFGFLFGAEWRQAGIYASYLVIAAAMRFAVSPLSTVLVLEQNMRMGVFWQVLYLCTISTTLYCSVSMPIEWFIIAFVVHEVVLYLLYMLLIIKGAKSIAS